MSNTQEPTMANPLRVTPKEMRWGVTEEPEIFIPKDLPRKNGQQDVINYIRSEYPDVDSKRVWRLAFEAIPARYFFTPHNDKICWRHKDCYYSLFLWLDRGKREEPKRSAFQRLMDYLKSM